MCAWHKRFLAEATSLRIVNMNASKRILVVEDNNTTARTLQIFLESEGFSVDCVENGRRGLEQFREANYDLIVLDLLLPDLDGLSVCRSIRESAETPIVMLTAKTAEDEIVEGLEAGADDYVCKPFGSRELLARIRRCLRSAVASSNRLQVGSIELDVDERSVWIKGDIVKLTKSEFDILLLLMKNPGRVFTRDQIIERALGTDYDGFDRTIDTHVWSLRKKLNEPRGAPRYIRSELGVGYRMATDHEK